MDGALERILNLLLESERAGVVALDELSREVDQEELRRFLVAAREDEAQNAAHLEDLIKTGGGTPSDRTGPFAEKLAAQDSLRDRMNLLSRGQEWVARKIEEALAIAPEGPIRDYLQKMANRHRHEVEWGRAEVIRLMSQTR
jgi:nitronate monooxygenase